MTEQPGSETPKIPEVIEMEVLEVRSDAPLEAADEGRSAGAATLGGDDPVREAITLRGDSKDSNDAVVGGAASGAVRGGGTRGEPGGDTVGRASDQRSTGFESAQGPDIAGLSMGAAETGGVSRGPHDADGSNPQAGTDLGRSAGSDSVMGVQISTPETGAELRADDISSGPESLGARPSQPTTSLDSDSLSTSPGDGDAGASASPPGADSGVVSSGADRGASDSREVGGAAADDLDLSEAVQGGDVNETAQGGDVSAAAQGGDMGAGPDGGHVRIGEETSSSVKYSQEITSPDDEPEREGRSLATTHHEVIRQWAEERGGTPATVEGTEHGDHLGVLRLDFGGNNQNLSHVSWEEWFDTFDVRRLNFIYQEQRRDGRQSNFFRLESPDREDG